MGDHSIITRICLIRHGETDWNASGRLQGREDIELNDLGREQALELADYFKTGNWNDIVSSPLKRAFETAEILAAQLDLPHIIVRENFIERDYGEASGLLPEDRKNRFPDGVIPGQEEFEHLRGRAFKALNEIADELKGRSIIVVTHGAFANSILYTISGGEFGSFKTRLKNACLNLIEFSGEQWEVVFYNKTAGELI
jgi:uncharacterized phosphatase